ncbi:amidohydrolase [uncultured Corynebacterium sp.]|uniref:amidohydrolase n=1 Tax=uncultured Corynebacterium sp. TaxID=159447 RepID=UPI00288BCB0D|nr:amidohydrolase [uncultured Corynebacterium sp.]
MRLEEKFTPFLQSLEAHRGELENLYKWFHQNPELSMQEFATSARIQEELEALGVEVVPVGTTGLVGVVRNGDGPTVGFRADFDALPIKEETGLEYSASPELGIMHACGHDMHTTALLGAVRLLQENTDAWSGTFLAIFQPGEETGAGAQDMADAGLATKVPTPEVVLGQHVGPMLPNYGLGALPGPVFAAAEQTKVTIYGQGAHGSQPHNGIDPVVIAASIITRLQTIVAREVDPQDMVVVTVGAVHAGNSANTIAATAEISVSTRAFTSELSEKLNASIKRIVRAECEAAGTPKPPAFERIGGAPEFHNDEATADTVMTAFRKNFDEVGDFGRLSGSEDFPTIGNAFGAPYFYWFLGSVKDIDGAPSNHSPYFAPDLQPVLDRSIQAILVSTSPWLMRG